MSPLHGSCPEPGVPGSSHVDGVLLAGSAVAARSLVPPCQPLWFLASLLLLGAQRALAKATWGAVHSPLLCLHSPGWPTWGGQAPVDRLPALP